MKVAIGLLQGINANWRLAWDVSAAFFSCLLTIAIIGQAFSWLFILYSAVFTLIAAGFFLWTGAYKTSWRYLCTRNITHLSVVSCIISIAFIPCFIAFWSLWARPIGAFVIQSLLFFVLYISPRLLCVYKFSPGSGIKCIVVGSIDDIGKFMDSWQKTVMPVACVTTDYSQTEDVFYGVPVLGGIEDFDKVLVRITSAKINPDCVLLLTDVKHSVLDTITLWQLNIFKSLEEIDDFYTKKNSLFFDTLRSDPFYKDKNVVVIGCGTIASIGIEAFKKQSLKSLSWISQDPIFDRGANIFLQDLNAKEPLETLIKKINPDVIVIANCFSDLALAAELHVHLVVNKHIAQVKNIIDITQQLKCKRVVNVIDNLYEDKKSFNALTQRIISVYTNSLKDSNLINIAIPYLVDKACIYNTNICYLAAWKTDISNAILLAASGACGQNVALAGALMYKDQVSISDIYMPKDAVKTDVFGIYQTVHPTINHKSFINNLNVLLDNFSNSSQAELSRKIQLCLR